MHIPVSRSHPSGVVSRAVLAVVAFFALILLPARPLHAQLAGKGAITGVIADSSGAAIPGATVTAINDASGISTKQTTTGAGDYNIQTLDPGIYTVTIVAPGFQTVEQKNVHVNALESQTLSPKLTVGAESETITVTDQPAQLETSNAALGGTLEQEVYSALPIEMGAYGQPDQRRATDFVFLIPGVQVSGSPTTSTGIVNGSRSAVTPTYIEGVAFVRAAGNGDPRFVWTAISVDAVDQLSVQTSGFSAQYEGQGVQNYSIKQGGNKFHGSVYEFFRNTALDTWGFFGPLSVNPLTGKPLKPIEHSNEYGINLGGPLVPFGTWKEKLFFFGNYNGFRYSSQTPLQVSYPTLAEQGGNFQGLTNPIYDPSTQAACTANSTDGPCRYRYGQLFSGTKGARGGPASACAGSPSTCLDVIPSSQFSPISVSMQKYLPQLTNQNPQNNYVAPNKTALTNWSHTERVDYVINDKQRLTFVAAIGRQASSVPVGQTGGNVGPLPYNRGQAYAPKTAVGIVEHTYAFSPHVINQLKYGYARYDGPTFDANEQPPYAATAFGITNLPSGTASNAFPGVTFSGTNAPTAWAGLGPSRNIAQNYTLVDNVQWSLGRHSLTLGSQIAWLSYANIPGPTGSSFLALTAAVSETAQYVGTSGSLAALSGTGLGYASFLIGNFDTSSVTTYAVREYGSRFRAISPYVQDNFKVTSKLTLDLGLRWDYFPPVHENVDSLAFYNPSLTNPVTNLPGALQFAGTGPGTCNCHTPVNAYFGNFGPRIGAAYQLDPTTVLRASYGIMFTHGGGTGGSSAAQLGSGNTARGFSTSGTTSQSSGLLPGLTLNAANTAVPSFAPALGRASGAGFGTGYTTVAGYTGTPQGLAYFDPYTGSRSPEYVNYTFGFQHQFAEGFTTSVTYAGSQGHFLTPDGSNIRGPLSNALDPRYNSLGDALNYSGSTSTKLATFCASAAANGVCPSYYPLLTSSQTLATLLRPNPFESISDQFYNVANSNYNSLQTVASFRAFKGLTFNANYTWSRSIDNAGTFRTGYDLPAAYSNTGQSYTRGSQERTVSANNQPHKFVASGVWELPFGKSIAASNSVERAILGGFKLSTIFQAYTGSPLVITGSTCTSNPANNVCTPNYNPNTPMNQRVRINGKWGQGVTAADTTKPFIDTTAFALYTPSTLPAVGTTARAEYPSTAGPLPYTFGNLPRTAAYNLYGPGNYQLDLALVRTFPLHFEGATLNFRAEYYNVTNHTKFAVASTAVGNSNFGRVTSDGSSTRRAAQFSARINF